MPLVKLLCTSAGVLQTIDKSDEDRFVHICRAASAASDLTDCCVTDGWTVK